MAVNNGTTTGQGGDNPNTGKQNLDFDLSGIQKSAMTEEPKTVFVKTTTDNGSGGEQLTEEQKAAKTAEEVKKAAEQSGKTPEQIAEEEAAKKKAEEDAANEGVGGDDETPEVFINDEGNLVNEKGEIVRKKGTFEFDEETKEVTYIESVIQPLVDQYKAFGIEFKNESGEPIVFEDTPEGHLEFTKRVSNVLARNTINAEFENNPELKDFYAHLKAGKSALDFYKLKVEKPNYENVAFKEDDALQHEKIILDYLIQAKGNDEDFAKTHLKYLKDSENLKDTAKEYLGKLKTWQEDTEKARLEANNAKIKEKQNEIIDYYSKVKTVIENGKLVYRVDPQGNPTGSITIPEDKRKGFIERSVVIDDKGRTQADYAYENLSLDQRIFIDYLISTGFKFDDLIKVEAQNLNAKKLGKRVTIVTQGGEHKKHVRSTPVSNGDFGVTNIV